MNITDVTVTSLIPITWGPDEVAPFLGGRAMRPPFVSGVGEYRRTIHLAQPVTEQEADALIENLRLYVLANLITRTT